jgi:hypothetical protein
MTAITSSATLLTIDTLGLSIGFVDRDHAHRSWPEVNFYDVRRCGTGRTFSLSFLTALFVCVEHIARAEVEKK